MRPYLDIPSSIPRFESYHHPQATVKTIQGSGWRECLEGQETDDVMVGIPIHPIHHKVSCRIQDFRFKRVPSSTGHDNMSAKKHHDKKSLRPPDDTKSHHYSESRRIRRTRAEAIKMTCHTRTTLTTFVMIYHCSGWCKKPSIWSSTTSSQVSSQPGLWFCPRNRLRSNHSAAETSTPARMVLPENCWSQIAISRSHRLVLASNNALPGAHQSRSFQTMLVNSPL